jgi:hypothetical protein
MYQFHAASALDPNPVLKFLHWFHALSDLGSNMVLKFWYFHALGSNPVPKFCYHVLDLNPVLSGLDSHPVPKFWYWFHVQSSLGSNLAPMLMYPSLHPLDPD